MEFFKKKVEKEKNKVAPVGDDFLMDDDIGDNLAEIPLLDDVVADEIDDINLDSIDTADSMDSIESVEPIDTADSMEPVELIDTADSMDEADEVELSVNESNESTVGTGIYDNTTTLVEDEFADLILPADNVNKDTPKKGIEKTKNNKKSGLFFKLFGNKDKAKTKLNKENDKKNKEGAKKPKESVKIITDKTLFPDNLYIGYTKSPKKKDILRIIVNIVEGYFVNKQGTCYRLKKYNDGYIYEIHDGDRRYSCLDLVIKILNKKGEVVIAPNNKKIKVFIHNENIQSYYLSESDKTIGLKYQEARKMKRVFPSGILFLVLSSVFAFVSVVAVFLSFFYKFVIVDNTEYSLDIYSPDMSPYDYVERGLPELGQGEYINKIYFENNGWTFDKESINPAIEDVDTSVPANPEDNIEFTGDEEA
jgi:hypothetical protein